MITCSRHVIGSMGGENKDPWIRVFGQGGITFDSKAAVGSPVS